MAQSHKTTKSHPSIRQRWIRGSSLGVNPSHTKIIRGALIVVGVCAVIALGLASFTLAYQNKIYPNTYVGEVNIGGKSIASATEILRAKISSLPQNLELTVDATTLDPILLTSIDFRYEPQKTAEEAYSIGRVGSFVKNVGELTRSLFQRNQVLAHYSFSNEKLTAAVNSLSHKVGTPAVDAQIVLNEAGKVTLAPSKEGKGVDPEATEETILNHLRRFVFVTNLHVTSLSPKVIESQAQLALAQTEKIIAKAPVTLTADAVKVPADAKTVFSWLSFQLTDAPAATPSSSPVSFVPKAVAQERDTKVLGVSFNSDRMKDFVANMATTVNRDPENAELTAIKGQVTVAKEHVDGLTITIDEAVTALIAQLQTDDTSPLTFIVPMAVAKAEIRSDNYQSLGIKELIGHGETNFKGSPANRIHNISTGAKFLNGALVAPGKDFSTVQTLGAVDGSTGYLPELVIKENRTIPEYGGGLCQVSTTLFRATLDAGLKATERRNHSYRVSYYEPPVGLDATIYLPKPDFKFLNDTPGYILIQAKVEGTKITFDLYGTKDGRSSTISDPIVSDYVEPPTAIYTETDTLPKGETKQIEKPHQGATAVVTYVVTRDGKEINRQVFRSKYQAWAARYLVGTRE